MKAELIDLYSTDIPEPLSDFLPNVKDNFGFLVRMIVGEKSLGGEESFDFFLYAPNWLLSNYKGDDIVFGIHYLIVFEYNYEKIYNTLRKYINNLEEKIWKDIGLKSGRIGHWEFQDYRK